MHLREHELPGQIRSHRHGLPRQRLQFRAVNSTGLYHRATSADLDQKQQPTLPTFACRLLPLPAQAKLRGPESAEAPDMHNMNGSRSTCHREGYRIGSALSDVAAPNDNAENFRLGLTIT